MKDFILFIPYLTIILCFVFLLLNKIKIGKLITAIICIFIGFIYVISYIDRQYSLQFPWLILVTVTPVLGVAAGRLFKNKLVNYSSCLLILFANLLIYFEPSERHESLGNMYFFMLVVPSSIIAFIILILLDLINISLTDSSTIKQKVETHNKSPIIFLCLTLLSILLLVFLSIFNFTGDSSLLFIIMKFIINVLISSAIFFTLNYQLKFKINYIFISSLVFFLLSSPKIINFIYILVFRIFNNSLPLISDFIKVLNTISESHLHQISIFMMILSFIFYVKTQKIDKI